MVARVSTVAFEGTTVLDIDCHVEVPAVSASDLSLPPAREDSAMVASRIAGARDVQRERYQKLANDNTLAQAPQGQIPRTNAEADGELLEQVAAPDAAGLALLKQAAEQMKLSGRGYHRVLRVARTLADLAGSDVVLKVHVAEALSYRRAGFGRG